MVKKTKLILIVTLMALMTDVPIQLLSSMSVEAQAPESYPKGRYYLVPSNNTFHTNETSIGHSFNVTFYAFNFSACFAYQVKVYVDQTILDITGAWRAQWLPNWIFHGKTSVGTAPTIGNDVNGRYAVVADSLLGADAFNASGVAAIVEFTIVAEPPFGTLSCPLNITNVGTYWLGPTPATKNGPKRENGYYAYSAPPREIPTANIYVDPSRIVDPLLTPCNDFSVNVTIANATDVNSFEFKLGFNASLLHAQSAVLGDFFPPSVVPSVVIDNTAGYVAFSAALSPPETPKSGNGTLAIIEFHVESVGRCDLHLYDTAIRDQEDLELPYETTDGYFNNVLFAKMAVDPPEIIDPTLLPPKTFNVNITIDDVEDLYDYTFNLTFNNNVLLCLQASIHDVLGETNYVPEMYISNMKGFVWVDVVYYAPAVPIATYDPLTFVTITFRVKSPGVSHLNLTDTGLSDSVDAPITHEASNGFVMTLIRDLAVTNVVPSMAWAYAGWPVNVTMTVKNLGNVSETFDVRAFANITLIGSSTVFNLAVGATRDVVFTLDTTGYPESYLTLRAEVDIVPFEINTGNNEFIDGTVTILTTIRDVAVTNVVPSTHLPYENWVVNVSVTVKNLGQMAETFSVKAYYDSNLIDDIPVSLAVSEETTLIFSWNTSTAMLYYNYTISAEAALLPFEYNTSDNLFVDGLVSVRMMGDLNNDQKVDISDVAIVAYAFGSYPGHARWNPEADLNFDDFVDITDIAMVAFSFGRTY